MVDLPEEIKNMPTRQPHSDKPAERRREGEGSGERYSGQRSSYGRTGGGPRPPRDRDRERGGERGGERGAGPGGPRRGGPGGPRRHRRLFGGGKVCACCVQKVKYVDYKDLDFLLRFVSSQGKILPRRLSGACSRHQRLVTTAIKRARHIALLPFTA